MQLYFFILRKSNAHILILNIWDVTSYISPISRSFRLISNDIKPD